MSTNRIAVRVLVGNHTHRGRRCTRGEIIHLRHWQVQWLGASVQRVFAPQVEPRVSDSVALPPSPERDSGEADDDDSPDDPDPEPDRPAGGAVKHRQQGALAHNSFPPALTLHQSRTGARA